MVQLCPLCDDVFKLHSKFITHLRLIHNETIEEETFSFASMDDFKRWKNKYELEHMVFYCKHTAPRGLKNLNKESDVRPITRVTHYFSCHCTNSSLSHDKKKIKSSTKMDRSCPSRMILKETNLGFDLVFWSTHLGHKCRRVHVGPTKFEKECIADCLKQGISVEDILDKSRDGSLFGNSEDSARVFNLTKKTLNTMKRNELYHFKKRCKTSNLKDKVNLKPHSETNSHSSDFPESELIHDILPYPKGKYSNDARSVIHWVEENQKSEEPIVVYFKEQGIPSKDDSDLKETDFVLIIMSEFQKTIMLEFGHEQIFVDGTYELVLNNFILLTIMTIDGIPVAYMITNRNDQSVLELYFNKIKEICGLIIPKVFMSDDVPSYFNAWSSIMGPPVHQLLCTYHVNEDWKKNICKIKNKEKQMKILKMLQTLLTEPQEDYFCEHLISLIEELSGSDSKQFCEHFQHHYCSRTRTWAYCFRKDLEINENTYYLENIHKTKQTNLLGKKVRRLDVVICKLLELTRDKLFNRIIDLTKNTVDEKMKNIQNAHLRSEKINLNLIKDVSSTKWTVNVYELPERSYTVEKCESSCTEILCPLYCINCNICVHAYTCTCIDSLVKFNICKHIHACVRKHRTTKNEDCDGEDCNKGSEEIVTNSQHVAADSNTTFGQVNINYLNLEPGDMIVDFKVEREEIVDSFDEHSVDENNSYKVEHEEIISDSNDQSEEIVSGFNGQGTQRVNDFDDLGVEREEIISDTNESREDIVNNMSENSEFLNEDCNIEVIATGGVEINEREDAILKDCNIEIIATGSVEINEREDAFLTEVKTILELVKSNNYSDEIFVYCTNQLKIIKSIFLQSIQSTSDDKRSIQTCASQI